MKDIIVGFVPRIKIINNKQTYFVSDNYLKYFNEHNIKTLIINLDNIYDDLKKCDCIISTGGVDLNPKTYNEELTYSINFNDDLDNADKIVINYCKDFNIPYLGVCRGMQALNVFCGGTLYQDMIKQNHGEKLLNDNSHKVCKVNDFGLARVLDDEFIVNHYHHQGIKDLAYDFTILYEWDNNIEAIEHNTKPLIGVQWHPERDNYTDPSKIYEYLLSKIK